MPERPKDPQSRFRHLPARFLDPEDPLFKAAEGVDWRVLAGRGVPNNVPKPKTAALDAIAELLDKQDESAASPELKAKQARLLKILKEAAERGVDLDRGHPPPYVTKEQPKK